MLIKWLGHSCFKLMLKDGRSIIIDPFDDSLGYENIHEKADVVLVSHNHHDHSYTKGIEGDFKLIDKPGNFEINGIKITGKETFHDDEKGRVRGRVIVNIIEAEGIRLVHMSDTGEVPDTEFFSNMKKIDVLMVPVGGVFTIDAKGAFEIMEKLKPNITIPMHYMTSSLKFALKGVHEFTALAGKEYDISRLGGSAFEITADNLKKRQRIVVMDPAN